jgi:hypothetical protein
MFEGVLYLSETATGTEDKGRNLYLRKHRRKSGNPRVRDPSSSWTRILELGVRFHLRKTLDWVSGQG